MTTDTYKLKTINQLENIEYNTGFAHANHTKTSPFPQEFIPTPYSYGFRDARQLNKFLDTHEIL